MLKDFPNDPVDFSRIENMKDDDPISYHDYLSLLDKIQGDSLGLEVGGKPRQKKVEREPKEDPITEYERYIEDLENKLREIRNNAKDKVESGFFNSLTPPFFKNVYNKIRGTWGSSVRRFHDIANKSRAMVKKNISFILATLVATILFCGISCRHSYLEERRIAQIENHKNNWYKNNGLRTNSSQSHLYGLSYSPEVLPVYLHFEDEKGFNLLINSIGLENEEEYNGWNGHAGVVDPEVLKLYHDYIAKVKAERQAKIRKKWGL
jgi:hypothetical protein